MKASQVPQSYSILIPTTLASLVVGTFSFTSDMVTRGATPIGSDPQMIEKYYQPAFDWVTGEGEQGYRHIYLHISSYTLYNSRR